MTDIPTINEHDIVGPRQRPVHYGASSEVGLGYTCYQHAGAFFLDRFYPSVATELTQLVGNRPYIGEVLVRFIDQLLTKIVDEQGLNLGALVKGIAQNTSSSAEPTVDDFAKAIEDATREGFLFVDDGFHGEVYISHVQEGDMYLVRITPSKDPAQYWKFGDFQNWMKMQEESNPPTDTDNLLSMLTAFEDDFPDDDAIFFRKTEADKIIGKLDLEKAVQKAKEEA